MYPGLGDVGAAVLESCPRSLIFGGTATVDRYRGNAGVQAHGPGFSKIVIGDDQVDQLGIVSRRDGRQRVPQQRARLHQLLGHLGEPPYARKSRTRLPSGWRKSARCRPTIPTPAWRRSRFRAWPTAISTGDRRRLEDARRHRRHGEAPRHGARGQAGRRRLRAADRPALRLARRAGGAEGIHVSVRDRRPVPGRRRCCRRSGRRWCAPPITEKPALRLGFMDATHIDRLNFGPVPTIQLNWRQPHEGNLIDFLFRARAFQTAEL